MSPLTPLMFALSALALGTTGMLLARHHGPDSRYQTIIACFVLAAFAMFGAAIGLIAGVRW